LGMISQLSEVEWQDRSPNNVSPFDTATPYAHTVSALIAIVGAGSAYLLGLAVDPTACGSGCGQNGLLEVDIDSQATVTLTDLILNNNGCRFRTIRFTGSVGEGTPRIVFPTPATNADSTEYCLENKSSGAVTISNDPVTGDTFNVDTALAAD